MQAAQIRFRGIWRTGENFSPGDVVARGRFGFEAIADHVAGCQSEPGLGEQWPRFWKPTDGYGGGASGADLLPKASERSFVGASGAEVLPKASQFAEEHPRSFAGASDAQVLPKASQFAQEHPRDNVSPFPVPVARPVASVPAAVPSASEIHDDSDAGGINVAHSLSLLRGMFDAAARREDLHELLSLLQRLERRIDAIGAPALEDPISAEAWRRKCGLLGVATRRDAEAEMSVMTREYVRLLRKRDKGLHLSPKEAARFAVLDVLDQALADIEAREIDLRSIEPADITDDKHWPSLGDYR